MFPDILTGLFGAGISTRLNCEKRPCDLGFLRLFVRFIVRLNRVRSVEPG